MHCPSWDDAFVSRPSLYCIVTRKLKSYVKDFNLRVTIVTPRQTKNNEYTNVHHTVVKNDRFINYNIFLY